MVDKQIESITVMAYRGNEIIHEAIYKTFPLVIGRSPQCQIALPYASLSRNHAAISLSNQAVRITDLDSVNGVKFQNEMQREFEINDKGEFFVADIKFSIEVRLAEANIPEENTKSVIHPLLEADEPIKPRGIYEPIPKPKVLDEINDRNGSLSFIEAEKEAQIQNLRRVALQGVITWGSDIFEVITFWKGERLMFGPNLDDMGYLPILNKKLVFGQFTKRGASLAIPAQYPWKIYRQSQVLTEEDLIEKNLEIDARKNKRLFLDINEVMAVEFKHDVIIYFRYVHVPRPFLRREWIENKEEFKKAIILSSLFHLGMSIFALFAAPRNQGPEIENIPPRFAKLLVEPPPQLIPPPPPPPPEPDKVEEKLVELPKPVPKPRPAIKHASVPRKIEPPKVQKIEIEKPKQKTESEQAADVADLFSSLPGPKAGSAAGLAKNIKIDSKTPKASAGGLPVSGMFKSLSKVGVGGQSAGGGPGAVGSALGKVDTGFAQGNMGSKVGKRKIEGAVIGTPNFKQNLGPQGLTQDEIMKVIQSNIANIHRCYERALFENAEIKGRIEYQWLISASGKVENVNVTRSDTANSDFLNRCVIDVIKKMRFPKSNKNLPTLTSIGFPFGRN